jgi:anti-sigma factor RsiW
VPELVEGDGISTRERKLLRLYGLGLATRQQRAAIKPAIEADPTCARFVRDMVETSRGAAALLPPPGAVGVADVGIVERAIAPLARLKERVVGSISDAAGAPVNVRRAPFAFPRGGGMLRKMQRASSGVGPGCGRGRGDCGARHCPIE